MKPQKYHVRYWDIKKGKDAGLYYTGYVSKFYGSKMVEEYGVVGNSLKLYLKEVC